jgi:hypothetical protein
MHTTTEPPLPPPPPFALSTDLDPSCEEHVDLAEDDLDDEEDQLHQDTQQEEVEFMGEYESLEAYFRGQLEPFIDICIQSWLFDALDMSEVQAQFECNGKYRYIREGGAIYRAGLPKPSKDKDDSPGPWMPTRGG